MTTEDGQQSWPEHRGYQVYITYNDDAMVQTMEIIRNLRDGKAPFDILVNDEMKARLSAAFDKGIECILNTQIRVNGKPTIWCQQHDNITLKPAPANIRIAFLLHGRKLLTGSPANGTPRSGRTGKGSSQWRNGVA